MIRQLLKITLAFSLVALVGCASAYQTKWQSPMESGDLAALQLHIDNGDHLVDKSDIGLTPLHTAARLGNIDVILKLLGAGAPINAYTKYKLTPLSYAVWHNKEDRTEVIQTLLLSGADIKAENLGYETPLAAASSNSQNVKALLKGGANPLSQVGHQNVPVAEYFKGLLELAKKEGFDDWEKSIKESILLVEEYSIPFNSLERCNQLEDSYQPDCFTAHLERFPNTETAITAQKNLSLVKYRIARAEKRRVANLKRDQLEKDKKEQAERDRVALINKAKREKEQARLDRIAKQECLLSESGWLYLSKSCRNKLAEGNGEAIQEEKNLKFVGMFSQGKRVSGELYVNDQLMYDGPIKDQRPHGTGTCIYNGEPEECKYYKGKRTDVLYKQRIEFIKQRELMASSEKRIQERLESSEKRMNENLSQIRKEASASRAQGNQGGQGNSVGSYASEALKKKAAEKTVDLLFDQLF